MIDTKYKEAEKLLLSLDESKLKHEQLGHYYLMLARTYKYEVKNDLAIANFNHAGKIFQRKKNSELILYYHIELLEFYRKTADFDRCFKLIDKLKYELKVESVSDKNILNFFYNRYAAVLNEQAKLPESIFYSLKAVELAKKNKDKYAEAVSYNELGFSYKNLGENNKSIEYYEKAYRLWMDIGCYRDAVLTQYNKLIIIAHNNLLPGKEQITLNEKLLHLIDSLNIDYPVHPIYLAIEFQYMVQQNWKLAYLYRVKSDSANEVALTNANFEAMNALKEQFQNEQLEERNKTFQKLAAERKAKLSVSETRFWWIFTFSTFVVLLSLVLFILWRKNRIQNQKLVEQNTQKTYLIQEIHHRVKNNLQFVKSILTLQQSLDELSASETIEDITRRIDAVSMVHEMLYVENDRQEINVKEYVDKLLVTTSYLYQTENRIQYNVQIPLMDLSLEKVMALGIIVSELLANSVKHVFSSSESPEFTIKLELTEGDLCLDVFDNGKQKKSEKEDNRVKLGMRIIDIFSRQLKGQYTIKQHKGYHFRLVFPR